MNVCVLFNDFEGTQKLRVNNPKGLMALFEESKKIDFVI